MYNTLSSLDVNAVVPENKYSRLDKLIAVTFCVFQFISKLRKKDEDYSLKAKQYLFKIKQEKCFPNELDFLKDPQNKNVPALVNNLNFFLDDDGIMRTKGRISKTLVFDYEIANPILLAKNHHLTELIIIDAHKQCKHLCIQTTLNKVRLSGYWIPKARQIVKRVISQCVTCQKINNLAFKYPKMTDLPKHRVKLVKPFLHTGIDYTGHIWVKNENGNNVKMYMLIFTCLNIRSIHIELIPDMSTHSFILALLRFTNIYGIPSYIHSDNARSFISGCKPC